MLSHIAAQVSARLPELALGYARAAVNRLLDRFSAASAFSHLFSIQRLELLSPKDGDVIAYQLMIPLEGLTRIGQLCGLGPAGLFAGDHAIFREAINNPSPFYRLLLAYRAFEGIAFSGKGFRTPATATESTSVCLRADAKTTSQIG